MERYYADITLKKAEKICALYNAQVKDDILPITTLIQLLVKGGVCLIDKRKLSVVVYTIEKNGKTMQLQTESIVSQRAVFILDKPQIKGIYQRFVHYECGQRLIRYPEFVAQTTYPEKIIPCFDDDSSDSEEVEWQFQGEKAVAGPYKVDIKIRYLRKPRQAVLVLQQPVRGIENLMALCGTEAYAIAAC
jgi:hypothetical protein